MSKSLNIILFGETGVGKSSLVNLIAGQEVAPTSEDSDACTMSYKPHKFKAYGTLSYIVWDTRGLDETGTSIGAKRYLGSVEQACKLIRELAAEGGVDLLVLCHRTGRVTTTMLSNYRLFYEVLCDAKVPIALVVTHLESYSRMEDWWDENAGTLERLEMKTATHACVTGLSGHSKSKESNEAIVRMLGQHDEKRRYHMPPDRWLVQFFRGWNKFHALPKGLKVKELGAHLQERCRFDCSLAQNLAEMIHARGRDDGTDEKSSLAPSTF